MLKQLGLLVLLAPLVSCEAGEPVDRPLASQLGGLWRLSDTPEFLSRGGSVAGDSVFYVGVVGGALLPSGDAVVTLGRGQNTVVFIDSIGELAAVLGGVGAGPNEFLSLPLIYQAGQQFFLMEQSRGRFRQLGDRRLGETRSFQRILGFRVIAMMEDGTVAMAPTVQTESLEDFEKGGFARPPYVFITGSEADTIIGPPLPPAPTLPFGHQRGPGTRQPGLYLGNECLPEPRWAVAGSQVLIADASTGLVLSLDHATGALDTIYRSEDRARVTQQMLDGGLENLELRSPTPAQRDVALRRLGEVGDPLRSAWSELLAGGDWLWLQHAVPCFEWVGTPQGIVPTFEHYSWEVIDVASGSRVAVMQTPSDLRLLAVAPDRVLAKMTDELGVEYVGVYRILR